MIKNKIFSELKAPVNKAKLITSWQNTNDIIEALKIQHQLNLPEAKKIAKYFKGDGEIQTAKNIFKFLKTEINYMVEPGEKQTTKSLSRFLYDGFGDCKHFSNFTNTIMQANGYKSLYRFSGYKGKTIQHVYAYLPKTDTICDAVLPTFDTEKTPKIKKDIDMSLYQLSGTDISGLNFKKVATNIKKAQAATSNVVKKAAASIPKAANDIKKGMVTAGLAAPRAAFLALVQLNFTGIASDFKKIIDQKGDEGIKWWVQLGGDRTSFTKAIEAGAKRKAILNGIDEENASYNEIYKGYSGDGVAVGVVAVATTAATATPILVKALEVIKKLKAAGIDPAKLADQVKKASAAFKDATGKNITDVIFKKEEGKTSSKTTIDASDLSDVDDATAEKVATAAIAQGAGVDSKTITDIAKKEAKGGNLISQFNALSTTKKIAVGGGALAVLGLIVYTIKKK